VAVFHLMQKALLHDSFSCSSAFARHTVPGRIFVEAYTYQQVLAATSRIPELIPTKMKFVPDGPRAQGWVRLLGVTKKLRHYKDDLALVVDMSKGSLLQLWLIRRIQYNNTTMTKWLIIINDLIHWRYQSDCPGFWILPRGI
jgi:hypothetical protein